MKLITLGNKQVEVMVAEFTPEMTKHKKLYVANGDKRTLILIYAYPKGDKLIIDKETMETLKKEKAIKEENKKCLKN